jgi:hypothetical protein
VTSPFVNRLDLCTVQKFKNMKKLQQCTGAAIASFINTPVKNYEVWPTILNPSWLQPCDIVLVEGDRYVSTAIKYLTQSTWSHAAIYVGGTSDSSLIEADVELGVIKVPLDKYAGLNVRVCRPISLSEDEKSRVITHLNDRLGHQYDLRNIVDLARYLWPMPLVPSHLRRSMISLGSGDPTRAICSTLIAEAFESVKFPILPPPPLQSKRGVGYTYIVPRDFDLSPYFNVIKNNNNK